MCTAGHGKPLRPCQFLDKVCGPCSSSLPLSTSTFPFLYRPGKANRKSNYSLKNKPRALSTAASCSVAGLAPISCLDCLSALLQWRKQPCHLAWTSFGTLSTPLPCAGLPPILFSQNHVVFTHTLSCNPRAVPKLFSPQRGSHFTQKIHSLNFPDPGSGSHLIIFPTGWGQPLFWG